MYHYYASGLMRIQDSTIHAIRESDGPTTDRLSGRASSKGCSAVHRIREEVVTIERGLSKKPTTMTMIPFPALTSRPCKVWVTCNTMFGWSHCALLTGIDS
jgi:hypothetical protein